MKKMQVTYHAPKGDNKVVEAYGHTFFDGKSEEVSVPDHVAEKMRGNHHFECSEPEDVDAHSTTKSAEQQTAEEDAAQAEDDAKRAAQVSYNLPRGLTTPPGCVPGEKEQPEPDEEAPPPEDGGDGTEGARAGTFRDPHESSRQDHQDR